MARNTGEGYRKGAVRNRSQGYNPRTDQWIKRNERTGQFMGGKSSPYKGVRKRKG